MDSSALVKLVIDEPESASLRLALSSYEAVVCSELALVEVVRAAARAAGDAGSTAAVMMLESVNLIRLDRTVLLRAARLQPAGLRSLDAIHVASALEVDSSTEMLAYDGRLLAAATAHGLQTVSPS